MFARLFALVKVLFKFVHNTSTYCIMLFSKAQGLACRQFQLNKGRSEGLSQL